MGLSCVVFFRSSHLCGTVVLYHPRLSLARSWTDDVGRFVQYEITFQTKLFRVACVYAPNRNPARDDFFPDVEAHVDPWVPTLLCGYFNAVFDRLLDRVGSDPLIFFVRALLLSLAFFRPAVSLIFGVICIRPLAVLLGLSGTAFLPPVLISSVLLFLGFLLSPPVISFLFRFLITVRFTYLSLSGSHCPGSWTLEVNSRCSR